MLSEVLIAYAEIFKMRVEMPANNNNFGFWRPWLDTGKLFWAISTVLRKVAIGTMYLFVCGCGGGIVGNMLCWRKCSTGNWLWSF